MDGAPSLLFVLLALLSGFCAGGWLAARVGRTLIRQAPGRTFPERLRASRGRRLLGAGAALAVLGLSLLLPVQSLVITAACLGFAFVLLLPPRPGDGPKTGNPDRLS